jgi:hypothetical protein
MLWDFDIFSKNRLFIKKVKTYFIALLIALPSVLFAKTNYHPGYVLKNNGDTLKGYIDYREWVRTPKSIQFKAKETDKNIQEFDPNAIKAFEISGMDRYISYSGIISMDKTDFPDVPVGLDTSKASDTIFLQQVTTGKHLTLYYQNDDVKGRFFISGNSRQITELRYYQYYSDDNVIIEAMPYKGQLGYYINLFNAGDKNLISNTERSKFRQSDLKKIVDKINGYSGDMNNKNKAKNSRFFAGAGINYTQALFDESYGHLFYESFSNAKVYPKLNAGYDVFVNPNVQQTILRAEVSISYVNPRFKLPDGSVYTFNQYTMSLVPQILFNVYNKNTFKIYIDGGISFNLSAYSNNKMTYVNSDYVEQSPYQLEPYWVNFPLQTGIVINKRLEFALTYTGAAAYTKYFGLSVANRTMSAGLKYLFGR